MNQSTTPIARQKNSGFAIASLILGISSLPFSFLCLGIVFAPAAVVFGHLARGQIRKQPERLTGKGMATAGLVLGYIGLGLTVLVVLLAGLDGFTQGLSEANEKARAQPARSVQPRAQAVDLAGTKTYKNRELQFSIQIPGTWNIKEVTLNAAFAPPNVTIEKTGSGFTAGFRPRYSEKLEWLVVMTLGRQKRPLLQTCRNYIVGKKIYQKSYAASEPKTVSLSHVSTPCAYFTETVPEVAGEEHGLIVVVPHPNGLFLMLQFRADPDTFQKHWKLFWKILQSLQCSN